MLKIVILMTAALIALTAGYNFKDSEFNQLILEDVQDFTAYEPLRSKRETEVTTVKTDDENSTVNSGDDKCHHGKWKKDQHCCNDGKHDPKIYESFRQTRQECYKEIHGDEEPSYDPFNCERLQKMKENAICVGECIARKFQLIDDAGVLKRDAIIEHLKSKFNDIPWKVKAAEGIVDKCLAAKSTDGAVDTNNSTTNKCTVIPLQFIHCMWKEFIYQCPKEMQSQSSKCQKLREKIEKGDDEGYLKHVHFHRFTHNHNHDDTKH